MNAHSVLMVVACLGLCCPLAFAETQNETEKSASVKTARPEEVPNDGPSTPKAAVDAVSSSTAASKHLAVDPKVATKVAPAALDTSAKDRNRAGAPQSKGKRTSLSMLDTMGQHKGAGRFSMHSKADRLQLSASLDLPASLAVGSSDFSLHSPVVSTEFLMRLTEGPAPAGHLWLGASVKPLGVSRAYPRDGRLTQDGHIVQAAFLGQYHQLSGSELRLRAGILPQHLGKADTLYWATLLPSRLDDNQLRLFDTALGLNMDYRRGWSQTLISVGQPLQRQHSPFESADGHRIQLANGWNVTHSKVLLGARLNHSAGETAYEINLHWLAATERLGVPLPLYVEGEIGAVTRPETHSNAIGSLYAYHELRLDTKPVQVKLRYDWTDADTELMYDTFHLVRIGLDYQPIKYTNISLQYRHRWSNTTNRTATTGDDLLMFVQLLY